MPRTAARTLYDKIIDAHTVRTIDENNVLTAQVVAAAVGADHNHIKQWFDDYSTKPADEEYPKGVTAGEISPQLDRLAMLRAGTHAGNGGLAEGAGNMIATYAVKLPQVPVTGHRADPQLRAVGDDVAELVRERIDVDEVVRLRQPQFHHRQKGRPSGERPGLGPELF